MLFKLPYHKPISSKAFKHYKDRYFLGILDKSKDQFLYVNKGRYELRTGLTEDEKLGRKVVVLSESKKADQDKFNSIHYSPYSSCKKVYCLEYLYNIKWNERFWWQRLFKLIKYYVGR